MNAAVTIVRTGATAAPAAGGAGATLLAFVGDDGVPGAWRLVSGGAVIGRGDDLAELPEQKAWVRTVLAVPGTDVAMHWLELDGDLTHAQAAAAARMRLADAVAAPIEEMHFAAGRVENGLTAIAAVPVARMQAWLDAARPLAIDPDLVIPAPLLLLAPGNGLVRHRIEDASIADYRGTARAFALEDDLAALLLGEENIADIDEAVRDAGLGPALADPAINLRQGLFARRREIVVDRARLRWLFTLAIVLLAVSLLIEIVTTVRTTFAADRIAAEAAEARAALGQPGQAGPRRGGFGAAAGVLFESVRDTPGAEVTQITYQADGSLRANLLADSQATLDGIRARIAQRGMQATGGLPSTVNGRAAGEIIVRPRS